MKSSAVIESSCVIQRLPDPGVPPRALTMLTLGLGARELARRHPALGELLRRHGTPPMWGRRPGFAALVRIILEQQVSLAAARTMYMRLWTRLGEVSPLAVREAGVPGLRALGLTRQKAGYCHRLAADVLDGRLDLPAIARAPDAVGRQALLAVPGLGPWSVDIYFLMALRRPDVWPQGDLALADALQRTLRMRTRPDVDRQREIASAWSPWRSIAARMLWQSYLASRGAAGGS